MHNEFNNIEERLNDFQTFEHEVTDDVWNNLEGDLLLNNSIASFNDFEFEVDDSIWEGIEDKLKTTRPKPIVWWMPGIVASLLLFSLGTYNLDYINNLGSNQNEESLIPSKTNNSLVVNKNDLVKSKVIDNNLTQKINNNTNDEAFNQNDIEQNGLYSENNDLTNNMSSINDVSKSSIKNNVNKLGLIAFSSNGKNDIPTIQVQSKSPVSQNEDNIGTLKFAQNEDLTSKNLITPNNFEIIQDDLYDNVSIENHTNSKVLNSNQNNVENNLLDSIISKEKLLIIEEDEKIKINSIEKEDKSENEYKKWKLIALGGVGNIRNIESSFDVVKPQKVKPLPVGLKSKTPQIIIEEEPINEGKVGLNYLKYAVPVNLSFGIERKITKSTALRVGLVYTKLNTEFEVYHEETHKLKLDYLAIPLTLVQTIKSWEKFRINSLALVRAEKLINSDHKLFDKDGLEYTDYSFANESKNILIGLGLEGEIDLLMNTSIVTNLKVNKYLQIDSQQEYKRDKQSLWPEINLGFSQKF